MENSIWNHNAAKYLKECKRLRALSKRIVEGKEEVIAGSRKMLQYRSWMKQEKNQDFDIFVVVDSESHHLPIGDVRKHWNKESLQTKDLEIKLVEDAYRYHVISSSNAILQKYSHIIEHPLSP